MSTSGLSKYVVLPLSCYRIALSNSFLAHNMFLIYSVELCSSHTKYIGCQGQSNYGALDLKDGE